MQVRLPWNPLYAKFLPSKSKAHKISALPNIQRLLNFTKINRLLNLTHTHTQSLPNLIRNQDIPKISQAIKTLLNLAPVIQMLRFLTQISLNVNLVQVHTILAIYHMNLTDKKQISRINQHLISLKLSKVSQRKKIKKIAHHKVKAWNPLNSTISHFQGNKIK